MSVFISDERARTAGLLATFGVILAIGGFQASRYDPRVLALVPHELGAAAPLVEGLIAQRQEQIFRGEQSLPFLWPGRVALFGGLAMIVVGLITVMAPPRRG